MTTIQQRLTRTLLLTLSVPLVIGGLVVYALIREDLVEQFDAALHARALAVASVIHVNGDHLEAGSAARFMRAFQELDETEHERNAKGEHEAEERDESDAAYFQVRQLNGASVLRSPSLGTADLPAPIDPREKPEFRNVTLPRSAGRALSMLFTPQPGAIGVPTGNRRLMLTVAADRGDLNHILQTIALMFSGGGALLLAATFVLVPRVVRRQLAPLDQMAERASSITAESLDMRFATTTLPGELTPIAERLNDLLARLEASFERERQFSGDLSHELRTPIAELRNLAELSLKWPDARPADADKDTLAIATHLENIVTRMLALLRSDKGSLVMTPEVIQLNALIPGVWRTVSQAAEAKALRVSWNIAADTEIVTDPALLRSIVANLLENAVEYTPEHGRIHVSAEGHDASFDVRVTNDTTQLAESDVRRLFDRFWRQDASRTGTDHSGLGLSLARAFARLLGGDLDATLDSSGQLTLRLWKDTVAARRS